MKASIHNLGCKVNSYETFAMEQELKNAGYEIVPFSEDTIADIYIINTCSVTNMADRKSRQMLHKAKKMNPDSIVIAAGCYAQTDTENSMNDSGVDIIIGNNRKHNIIDIINEYMRDHNKIDYIVDISKEKEYENLELTDVCEHTRAYIKVQDGCNQFCSYCIIPFARGRVRSRKKEDTLREIKTLVEKGYKEFVLTGIHLSSYGLDFKQDMANVESTVTGKDYKDGVIPGNDLLSLIEDIDAIEGVERIRLGSLEPRIVTDEFTKRLAQIKSICPHFHLSLQSGSDTTLKRMNRRYDTKEYEESCNILRKYFVNAAITTDVIVGFPQETQEEFNETVEFLKKIHFFEMHIFKYSRRKGTVADKMSGQIAESVKNERSAVLLKLEKEMSMEYRQKFVGKKCKVLFEEFDDGYMVGHTENYIKVKAECEEKETEILKNKIMEIDIDRLSSDGECLIGKI